MTEQEVFIETTYAHFIEWITEAYLMNSRYSNEGAFLEGGASPQDMARKLGSQLNKMPLTEKANIELLKNATATCLQRSGISLEDIRNPSLCQQSFTRYTNGEHLNPI